MSDFKPSSLRRAAQSKKKPPELILGYTRTGRSVLRPTRGVPDNGADSLIDWTKGDHADAARILKEHGERERDQKLASWCKRWAIVHKVLGGRGSRRDEHTR